MHHHRHFFYHATLFTEIPSTKVALESFSDLFSNLCHIASREHVKVLLESASSHHLPVPFLIERLAPDDVVPQGGILEPRLLGHICHTPLQV